MKSLNSKRTVSVNIEQYIGPNSVETRIVISPKHECLDEGREMYRGIECQLDGMPIDLANIALSVEEFINKLMDDKVGVNLCLN